MDSKKHQLVGHSTAAVHFLSAGHWVKLNMSVNSPKIASIVFGHLYYCNESVYLVHIPLFKLSSKFTLCCITHTVMDLGQVL